MVRWFVTITQISKIQLPKYKHGIVTFPFLFRQGRWKPNLFGSGPPRCIWTLPVYANLYFCLFSCLKMPWSNFLKSCRAFQRKSEHVYKPTQADPQKAWEKVRVVICWFVLWDYHYSYTHPISHAPSIFILQSWHSKTQPHLSTRAIWPMVAAFSTMVNLHQSFDPNLPAPAAAAPPPPPATTNWPWPRLKQKEHATAGNLTKKIEVSVCSTCGFPGPPNS